MKAVSSLLVLALAGCGGPWIPVANQGDATRTSIAVEELNRGRSLLVSACSDCHQPPSPRDRRAAEWPEQVEEMRERAHLEPPDAEAVTRYLAAFASDVSR